MLHIGETCRSCTRASECTPKHGLPSPQPQHAPASSKQYQTTTNHNSNTSSSNRIPQSTFETLTWCIAARQPSIRSKPQRMKRDLHEMLHIGETGRPCTRASQCTPKHSLSSPQQQHAPASSNQITNTHTTTNHSSNTQATTTASLNQRSQNSPSALQHVSLRSDQSLNA